MATEHSIRKVNRLCALRGSERKTRRIASIASGWLLVLAACDGGGIMGGSEIMNLGAAATAPKSSAGTMTWEMSYTLTHC